MLLETKSSSEQAGSMTVRMVLIGAAIGLVYWAGHRYDNFTDSMNMTFSVELWRWFLASGLMVLAGIAAGLAIRPASHGHRWLAALAAAPFALAMSFPAWIWGWPGTRQGSWLWSVVGDFASDRSVMVLWLLVGLALSGGLPVPGGFPARALRLLHKPIADAIDLTARTC